MPANRKGAVRVISQDALETLRAHSRPRSGQKPPSACSPDQCASGLCETRVPCTKSRAFKVVGVDQPASVPIDEVDVPGSELKIQDLTRTVGEKKIG